MWQKSSHFSGFFPFKQKNDFFATFIQHHSIGFLFGMDIANDEYRGIGGEPIFSDLLLYPYIFGHPNVIYMYTLNFCI